MHTTFGTPSRDWLCGCVVVALFVAAGPALAQDTKPAKEERSSSMKVRGSADRMRAAFESRFSSHSLDPDRKGVDSDEAKEEAKHVIAAFQAELDHPDAKVVVYTTLRLAGFYNYLGQQDKAMEVMKELASVYENTPHEPRIAFSIGLQYAQGNKKDPDAAIEWFRKVPMPDNFPIDDHEKHNETAQRYMAAQMMIANVTLIQLGKRDEAKIIFSPAPIPPRRTCLWADTWYSVCRGVE